MQYFFFQTIHSQWLNDENLNLILELSTQKIHYRYKRPAIIREFLTQTL